MIAVVDRQIERRIIIGAAASAGHARGFVKRDASAGVREPERAGKPREARADDMDRVAHVKA